MISNLQTTPKGEKKRSYLNRSLLGTTLLSIWVRYPLVTQRPISEHLHILAARPFQESFSHRETRKYLAARWRLYFRAWHGFLLSYTRTRRADRGFNVRFDLLISLSNEAHRGPYVLT